MGDNGCSGNLPPGFIFSPSDEELILHFLDRKASLLPCHPDIIPDLGLYPQDPWQLEGNNYFIPVHIDCSSFFLNLFLLSPLIFLPVSYVLHSRSSGGLFSFS